MDRDENAATNILKRGMSLVTSQGVEASSEQSGDVPNPIAARINDSEELIDDPFGSAILYELNSTDRSQSGSQLVETISLMGDG